jgi:hypothetical protein
MSNELPRVSIIILNWNGWKDTLECLESIYQIDYPIMMWWWWIMPPRILPGKN